MDNQQENQVQTQTSTPTETIVSAPVENQMPNQPGTKKKITLPIKVVIIGCAIGLLIAGIGVVKQINAKKINEQRRQAAVKASDEAVEAANKRLDEIVKEYDELKKKYSAKTAECDAINKDMSNPDWFEKSSKCSKESQELQQQLWELEAEDDMIKAKDYGAYYQTVKPMTYLIFYIIGGSIAFLALLGAFIIYLVKGKKTYE